MQIEFLLVLVIKKKTSNSPQWTFSHAILYSNVGEYNRAYGRRHRERPTPSVLGYTV